MKGKIRMLRKCTEERRIVILQKPLVWKKNFSFSISVSWDAWFTSQPLSITEQLISIILKCNFKMSLSLETNSRYLLMHLPYQLRCKNHTNWTPHHFASFITTSQNSSDRVNNRNVGVLFRTEETDLPKRFIFNKTQWVLRFWTCTRPRKHKRKVSLTSIIYFWVFGTP
jgi:UDP:flavonoid glycosyltransferase YjiC (YdhE family)